MLKRVRALMRLNIKIIDNQLSQSKRRNFNPRYGINSIDYIHSLFQEMEDMYIDLPMGDYNLIYDMLESVREELLERFNDE